MKDTGTLTAAAMGVATNHLTLDELVRLNLVAQADWDPQGLGFYDKVKHLFTKDDETKMHHDAKEALARVVLYRLDE